MGVPTTIEASYLVLVQLFFLANPNTVPRKQAGIPTTIEPSSLANPTNLDTVPRKQAGVPTTTGTISLIPVLASTTCTTPLVHRVAQEISAEPVAVTAMIHTMTTPLMTIPSPTIPQLVVLVLVQAAFQKPAIFENTDPHALARRALSLTLAVQALDYSPARLIFMNSRLATTTTITRAATELKPSDPPPVKVQSRISSVGCSRRRRLLGGVTILHSMIE